METVKIYNLKKLIEAATKGRQTVYSDEHAIIVNEENGDCIITDREAIHSTHVAITDTLVFNLYDKTFTGTIEMIPSSIAKITMKEIMDNCEYRKAPLTVFVRSFGARIEDNYAILLEAIEQIGLNPEDHPRERDMAGEQV